MNLLIELIMMSVANAFGRAASKVATEHHDFRGWEFEMLTTSIGD
jgi:hypothetical protein